MLKSILSVVVGYLVMVAVAMPIFGLVYVVPDFVFEEGQAKATLVFSLSTMIAGFAGALAGGWAVVKIAGGSSRPVKVLAGLVLGLGLAMAVAGLLMEPPPQKTPQEITRMPIAERAEIAREPVWYSFTMPFVGAFGVVLGGRARRRGEERSGGAETAAISPAS